jgi:hypothetical protein
VTLRRAAQASAAMVVAPCCVGKSPPFVIPVFMPRDPIFLPFTAPPPTFLSARPKSRRDWDAPSRRLITVTRIRPPAMRRDGRPRRCSKRIVGSLQQHGYQTALMRMDGK